MNRSKRTMLLIEFGREEALQMANEISTNYEVEHIQPPREGLVMVKMRESAKQSLFYIGEVLMTEAKVKIGDHFGLGIVRESEPELSTALAIIDCSYRANLPEVAAWDSVFEKLQQKMDEEVHNVKRSIERTRVNFETMKI